MPGFATFDPMPASLDSNAIPIVVFRLTSGSYQLMPNIRCLGIKRSLGANAGSARFRYVFDTGGTLGDSRWPINPEQILAPGASGRYIISQDDRLVVFAITDQNAMRIIFDGFAQVPSLKTTTRDAAVEINAVLTPFRCGDTPMWTRAERSADTPTDTKANRAVELPIIFNPDGMANATDAGADAVDSDMNPIGPIFLDPLVCKSRAIGRRWSLAMAVRYILKFYNDEVFVTNPDLTNLDSTMVGIKPTDPEGPIDPRDPATFTTAPITIREFDATGEEWPVVLEKLLAIYGFSYNFALQANSDTNLPVWTIKAFRVADDDPATFERVFLQPEGADLDPAQTNVMSMRLARDTEKVANDWTVISEPKTIEASFILAPGYSPSALDATTPNLFKLVTDKSERGGGDANPANLDKYRVYVFDETGDFHWDFGTGAAVTGKGTSLALILSRDGKDETRYVKRRRVAKNRLISGTDPDDAVPDPLQVPGTDSFDGIANPVLLMLSYDYKGPSPGIWDGSGTWYEAGRSFDLLPDRLGVRLTAQSIEGWNTGNKAIKFGKNLISSGGLIKGVSAQAIPTETHFTLMLVAVIEGDYVLSANAPKRAASPTKYTVKRYVDARQRYKYEVISGKSWWGDPNGKDSVFRDDTPDAKYDASQRRAVSEMPAMTGQVVIGRLTNTYGLGDRITSVAGRGPSLRSNVAGQNEGPAYPLVVEIEYDFEAGQKTTLSLQVKGFADGTG